MKNTLILLRLAAYLEGISFLLLLGIAMPMKYYFHDPILVKYLGMVHGLLFVLYVSFLAIVHFQFRWGIWITCLAFMASFIPFGTFYADKKLFRI